MIVRPSIEADLPFLRAMLYEAACWRPIDHAPRDEVLADPDVARYLSGWGRPGDLGLVAEEDGAPLGAAWIRLFDADDAGYGFVAEDIPELTIAVTAETRSRGVGTALIQALLAAARAAGRPALSLSVEPDNPARRVYERAGFAPVGTNGGAVTMLLELRPA